MDFLPWREMHNNGSRLTTFTVDVAKGKDQPKEKAEKSTGSPTGPPSIEGRNKTPFRDRAICDKSFKMYIGTDRKVQKSLVLSGE